MGEDAEYPNSCRQFADGSIESFSSEKETTGTRPPVMPLLAIRVDELFFLATDAVVQTPYCFHYILVVLLDYHINVGS